MSRGRSGAENRRAWPPRRGRQPLHRGRRLEALVRSTAFPNSIAVPLSLGPEVPSMRHSCHTSVATAMRSYRCCWFVVRSLSRYRDGEDVLHPPTVYLHTEAGEGVGFHGQGWL